MVRSWRPEKLPRNCSGTLPTRINTANTFLQGLLEFMGSPVIQPLEILYLPLQSDQEQRRPVQRAGSSNYMLGIVRD